MSPDDNVTRAVESLSGNAEQIVYTYTGRAKKSKPLGKILYLWNCSSYIHQISKCNRL